jgi:cobalt-zinc-cadmium efflux system membrane fusion protein
MKTNTLLLALAVVLSVGGATACRDSVTAAAPQPAHDDTEDRGTADPMLERVELTPAEIGEWIKTTKPEQRSLNGHLTSMGKVFAHPQRMAIVSYPYSSRIAAVHVQIGSWVERGDLLLTLESEVVGESKSTFLKAITDLELARNQFERHRSLFDKGAVSQRSKQEAEAAFKLAENALITAEKRLHVLGFTEAQVTELSREHQIGPQIGVHSPLTGRIIKQQAILGGMVDQGTEIMTILDPQIVCVDAEVYERDIASVTLGQIARVTVPAFPDLTFTGKIGFIGDTVNDETRTVTVRFEVANPESRLKPGMFAQVRIDTAVNDRALVVPASAVLLEDGKPMLFVRDGNGFVPHFVTTGIAANGLVEINKSDLAGREIVSDGAFALKSRWQRRRFRGAHVH